MTLEIQPTVCKIGVIDVFNFRDDLADQPGRFMVALILSAIGVMERMILGNWLDFWLNFDGLLYLGVQFGFMIEVVGVPSKISSFGTWRDGSAGTLNPDRCWNERRRLGEGKSPELDRKPPSDEVDDVCGLEKLPFLSDIPADALERSLTANGPPTLFATVESVLQNLVFV
uniref:Uncharacterized protein n=1 Tax=Ascaris lumbricoides TaxID=6252 RepID=A0A0M3HNH1_ASCLU